MTGRNVDEDTLLCLIGVITSLATTEVKARDVLKSCGGMEFSRYKVLTIFIIFYDDEMMMVYCLILTGKGGTNLWYLNKLLGWTVSPVAGMSVKSMVLFL